jgi:hypothetical protein
MTEKWSTNTFNGTYFNKSNINGKTYQYIAELLIWKKYSEIQKIKDWLIINDIDAIEINSDEFVLAFLTEEDRTLMLLTWS